MIKFKQGANETVAQFEKEFASFEEAKLWVAKDKVEEYGDVLAYDGKFVGLTLKQSTALSEMTYEDAIEIVGHD